MSDFDTVKRLYAQLGAVLELIERKTTDREIQLESQLTTYVDKVSECDNAFMRGYNIGMRDKQVEYERKLSSLVNEYELALFALKREISRLKVDRSGDVT